MGDTDVSYEWAPRSAGARPGKQGSSRAPAQTRHLPSALLTRCDAPFIPSPPSFPSEARPNSSALLELLAKQVNVASPPLTSPHLLVMSWSAAPRRAPPLSAPPRHAPPRAARLNVAVVRENILAGPRCSACSAVLRRAALLPMHSPPHSPPSGVNDPTPPRPSPRPETAGAGLAALPWLCSGAAAVQPGYLRVLRLRVLLGPRVLAATCCYLCPRR